MVYTLSFAKETLLETYAAIEDKVEQCIIQSKEKGADWLTLTIQNVSKKSVFQATKNIVANGYTMEYIDHGYGVEIRVDWQNPNEQFSSESSSSSDEESLKKKEDIIVPFQTI